MIVPVVNSPAEAMERAWRDYGRKLARARVEALRDGNALDVGKGETLDREAWIQDSEFGVLVRAPLRVVLQFDVRFPGWATPLEVTFLRQRVELEGVVHHTQHLTLGLWYCDWTGDPGAPVPADAFEGETNAARAALLDLLLTPEVTGVAFGPEPRVGHRYLRYEGRFAQDRSGNVFTRLTAGCVVPEVAPAGLEEGQHVAMGTMTIRRNDGSVEHRPLLGEVVRLDKPEEP